ncbi:hypothetical protein BV25DRAFT_1831634 [Artomyces pyxidatus]|uniref:Uncharacterized protein n=1 Tax=Artomyces pyxidatus TaxID=48021 RepID=A0ACB8SLB7_9AGAM|nr:hypothetical protein BV25DRAFT_1831634 [Artomyces pyxidatus]
MPSWNATGEEPHNCKAGVTTALRPHATRSSDGVRCYYIDLVISCRVPRGAPALVTGTLGRDQEVHKLFDDIPTTVSRLETSFGGLS